MQYAGLQAAEEIEAFARELGDPPQRSPHPDPFVHWVERERLTLGPTVELVDPGLGKLDWLMLYGIVDRGAKGDVKPPPVFAMFNNLKSDFILARHLVWQVISENAWPDTGRFSDTLDYATYGPATSALTLAQRVAIDLLDKVAVTVNHYFELGAPFDKVHFRNLWRQKDNQADTFVIAEKVEKTIRKGVPALYALVEIADDLRSSDGILHPQKELRNAGTHRFIVLHDMGSLEHSRQALEIEHHDLDRFTEESICALRITRSTIQTLALAITQYASLLNRSTDHLTYTLFVPDHDWIRGYGSEHD